MGDIIQLNQAEIKGQLKDLVRGTVEETLNKLLDEEADRITNAHRYERNEERLDTRAGHYSRKLLTTSGEVNLKVPKLRVLPFETVVAKRTLLREESVEEALLEMHLRVWLRYVTSSAWGERAHLNGTCYATPIWRCRPAHL